MNCNDLHIATATIHFSEIEYFPHRTCYTFDITFDKTSTGLFNHLCFIPAGADEKAAEEFLKDVKQYFDAAGIHDGTDVAVLFSFSDSRPLAISAKGNELWIDVHEGVYPHVSPKLFKNLGVTFTSLTVH